MTLRWARLRLGWLGRCRRHPSVRGTRQPCLIALRVLLGLASVLAGLALQLPQSALDLVAGAHDSIFPVRQVGATRAGHG